MFLLKTRYATIIRIVAAILVPAFLVLDVAWANPEIFASKSTLARWAGLRDSGVAHEAASRYRDAAAGDRSFIVPVTDGTLHDVLERQNATSLTLPSDRILITDKAYSDNPSLLRALREHRQSVQATSEEPRATLASLKETELTPPAADKPAAAPDGNLVELAEVDEAKLESFLEGVELTDEEEEVIDKLFSFYEEHSIDDSRSKEGGTYAPTPTRWHIERLLLMCKKLGIDKGSRFYDLGHGNGMIAVIMAALGFKSCGDEINPQMARLADKLLDDIRNIPELARLLERKVVRIQEGDFLKNEHIPEFDVVYFYYTYPAAEEGVHAKRKFRDNVVAKLTGPTGLKKGAYFVTFQPPAKYWLDGTGLFDVIDAGYFKIYKLKDTTFGPHSAGAAELPSGTEPKMDYEVGTYEDRDRLEVGTGAGVYSAPEPSPEIHIEEAEKAFEELNKKIKKAKELNHEICALGKAHQEAQVKGDIAKYRFCAPVEILKKSTDIALTLHRLGLKRPFTDNELPEFELVVTGVTEEDRNLMKKLGSNEIKDALKLAKNITVTAITEEEIQSRLKRTDKRVTDPENGLPIEFLRADAVYGILREKYPLKDGELAAIVSDAVSEAEADALLKLFEDVLPKKVSFCVAVAPEKGEAAFSLSSFIAKWLAEIEEGHNASAIKLPAIKMPADIIEDLEKSLAFALYVLASA